MRNWCLQCLLTRSRISSYVILRLRLHSPLRYEPIKKFSSKGNFSTGRKLLFLSFDGATNRRYTAYKIGNKYEIIEMHDSD